MKRILVGALALAFGTTLGASAQSLDDLNIQIHGYATQGLLYTTNNNMFTTNTSDGSAEWSEVVLNVSSQPTPKLRVSFQGRYFLLGNYGDNAFTPDYASADYKFNDKFGVRFGKVKIPSGLFNEIQDIDPSYQWALLPQSVYPISSRNGQLALYGGLAYGTVALPNSFGKLEYRVWGGESKISGGDGYFVSFVEEGISFDNGISGPQVGGAIHWKTPLAGLMIGASDIRKGIEKGGVSSPYGAAVFATTPQNEPTFFAKYEKNKVMVAGEYNRLEGNYSMQFAGPKAPLSPYDERALYVMATYKITEKLTAGVYDSDYNSHAKGQILGPTKYSKDWAISGRYDFNQYLYAKVEEHLVEGTAIGYDVNLNPNGLKPNTKLTILKVGVSF